MAEHIATYPLFAKTLRAKCDPMIDEWDTRNRVGTGYVYRPEQIREIEAKLDARGHPFRIRWRNDECLKIYQDWLKALDAPEHNEPEITDV
jgi:hypothetical protein